MKNEKRNLFSPLYSDIAYDDAFRMIESNCDDILIYFVNYLFKENYDATAVITHMRNEHFIENKDHSKEKRITDSHFSIMQNGIDKKYHLECESGTYDGTILVRLFEYDAMIASDLAEGDERKIFLIPFYIFNFEKELKEINDDEKRIEELAKLYVNILQKLEDELRGGRLQDSSYSVIITVTHSVFYKLTMNHPNVQEKVGDIMGGKDLELPEVMFYRRGLEEGEAKGFAEGEAKGEAERKALSEEIERLRKENELLKSKQLVNE